MERLDVTQAIESLLDWIMATQTEVISRFLNHETVEDLAKLYNLGMEVQVNVAQGNGERIESEYKGKTWQGWNDGLETWKPIRIPYNANSNPEYTDRPMTWNLEKHVEAIGMTGWDWQNKVSRWVAFDFDSIVGHSEKHLKKLSDEELDQIRKAVTNIPWVTLRYSTGGNGLHLYVFLPNVPTQNHNEHAALGRAILSKLSGLTGYNFESKVDACGGNMWVWHRKMKGTKGLTLIKPGEILTDIPANWETHIKVVSGHKRRVSPSFLNDTEVEGVEKMFNELCGQITKNNLDEDHKRLIAWLDENGAQWWWDTDHNMLITHTADLKKAHDALGFKGIFRTTAKGREKNDHNCFCFPLRKGGWCVRRYSRGAEEDSSWEQDGQGWTKCQYNCMPDLATACRAHGGIEHTNGGFVFKEAEQAGHAAHDLGINLDIPARMRLRVARLKEHKDGRLIVEIKKDEDDTSNGLEDWLKEGKAWKKIFKGNVSQPMEHDTGNYDDVIRHMITPNNEDYGWVIKGDGEWRNEPLTHVKHYLQSLGLKPPEVFTAIGASVVRAWKVVSLPFQPEYIGDRIWNRFAPQYKVPRKENRDNLSYPTWQKMLNHCGAGLDQGVKDSSWCRANGILTGGDYLKVWVASLLQEPTKPLPYLFFYGPQNSGKTTFYEAIELLVTRGVTRAHLALTSEGGFNAEIRDAILCVVEELDLRTGKSAYNRIKDWVTARTICIHEKRETPYTVDNHTHWIQCANDRDFCPVFPGDTRITMCYVPELDVLDLIPKTELIELLQKEASDFLTEVLHVEIPKSNDRLNVQVIITADKMTAEEEQMNMVELFIQQECYHVDGEHVNYAEFYDKFFDWLPPEEQLNRIYTKNNASKLLPRWAIKGRNTNGGQLSIGNLSFTKMDAVKTAFVKDAGGFLRHA